MSQAQAASKANGEWSQVETEFQDRNIRCVDCNEDFIWTGGEQVFFHDKGLKNEPKRQALQASQERTARRYRRRTGFGRPPAHRSFRQLRAVWSTDNGSLLSLAGSPGLLPLLLPRKPQRGDAGRHPTLSTTALVLTPDRLNRYLIIFTAAKACGLVEVRAD